MARIKRLIANFTDSKEPISPNATIRCSRLRNIGTNSNPEMPMNNSRNAKVFKSEKLALDSLPAKKLPIAIPKKNAANTVLTAALVEPILRPNKRTQVT